MVCTKSPKHKQKQGVHTGARERGGGDTATTFAASAMKESESSRPLVSWEADGKHYYVEMGMVPKYMYDELDLARFDDQAKAEAAAREMDEEEE